jgi:TldD protein
LSVPCPTGPPGEHFAAFGVTTEILQKILSAALQTGGDDCDLYFEHSASTSVALSDGKVNQASTHVDLGMGVRVRTGDQVGYAYSEDLSASALIRAARTAAGIAAGATPGVALSPLAVAIPNHYPVILPWTDVDITARVKMVRAWEQAAFAKDERIRRVECSVSDAAKVVMIVRPDGRLIQDWRPMTKGMIRCTAEGIGPDGQTLRESNSHNVAGRAGLEYLDPDRQDRLVDTAVKRTLFLLDAQSPAPGEMPVVLAAGPSAILLHEAIGHGMEADFNRKRISIYADKLAKRIASDQVTITDDGTVPGARGSINIDDEGNPTERTVLVENGILRSYMHDELSAAHYGIPSTGSGRRQSFRHAPMPRMRTTAMDNGPHDPSEIIESVKKGLYCVSFSNGSVNIGGGDFAFYMKHGYLIENGKLTRPVKDVNIIGNGPEALERIDMVANDTILDEGGWTCGKNGQSVPVSQGMPTVRVGSLVVGGAGS